jgi:hypothetical protein
MTTVAQTVRIICAEAQSTTPQPFMAAFLGFVAECEKRNLRIDNITFREIRKSEIVEVGTLFGIKLNAKEVID